MKLNGMGTPGVKRPFYAGAKHLNTLSRPVLFQVPVDRVVFAGEKQTKTPFSAHVPTSGTHVHFAGKITRRGFLGQAIKGVAAMTLASEALAGDKNDPFDYSSPIAKYNPNGVHQALLHTLRPDEIASAQKALKEHQLTATVPTPEFRFWQFYEQLAPVFTPEANPSKLGPDYDLMTSAIWKFDAIKSMHMLLTAPEDQVTWEVGPFIDPTTTSLYGTHHGDGEYVPGLNLIAKMQVPDGYGDFVKVEGRFGIVWDPEQDKFSFTPPILGNAKIQMTFPSMRTPGYTIRDPRDASKTLTLPAHSGKVDIGMTIAQSEGTSKEWLVMVQPHFAPNGEPVFLKTKPGQASMLGQRYYTPFDSTTPEGRRKNTQRYVADFLVHVRDMMNIHNDRYGVSSSERNNLGLTQRQMGIVQLIGQKLTEDPGLARDLVPGHDTRYLEDANGRYTLADIVSKAWNENFITYKITKSNADQMVDIFNRQVRSGLIRLSEEMPPIHPVRTTQTAPVTTAVATR